MRAGFVGGVLEALEQARAQAFGVGDRVERERVLVGAGYAEVVGHRTGREDQVVRRMGLPTGRGDAELVHIDGVDLGLQHGDGRSVGEDVAQRPGDVGGGQLAGCHLVEQRLELVVVVPVDQRDVDVVLGQLGRAPDPGEASADHEDGRSGDVVVSHDVIVVGGTTLRQQPDRVISRARAAASDPW